MTAIVPPSPPLNGLTIRATRPGDVEGLTRLMNLPGVRFGTLQLPFQSEELWRRRIEQLMQNAMSLVAEIEGQIVGTAGLHRCQGRRAHAAEIALSVHDDFRGRGIGTALLGALVDAADRWLNLMRLELMVNVDNRPAIALYEKFGFVIEGTCRAHHFRDGVFVDAYAMARLKPTAA